MGAFGRPQASQNALKIPPRHSDTNQWFFNPVDDKRQVTCVLLILAHIVSRTVNLEGTGCVLDG